MFLKWTTYYWNVSPKLCLPIFHSNLSLFLKWPIVTVKSICTAKTEAGLQLCLNSFLPRTLHAMLSWPSTAAMCVCEVCVCVCVCVSLWGRSSMGQAQKSISPLSALPPWPFSSPSVSRLQHTYQSHTYSHHTQEDNVSPPPETLHRHTHTHTHTHTKTQSSQVTAPQLREKINIETIMYLCRIVNSRFMPRPYCTTHICQSLFRLLSLG